MKKIWLAVLLIMTVVFAVSCSDSGEEKAASLSANIDKAVWEHYPDMPLIEMVYKHSDYYENHIKKGEFNVKCSHKITEGWVSDFSKEELKIPAYPSGRIPATISFYITETKIEQDDAIRKDSAMELFVIYDPQLNTIFVERAITGNPDKGNCDFVSAEEIKEMLLLMAENAEKLIAITQE